MKKILLLTLIAVTAFAQDYSKFQVGDALVAYARVDNQLMSTPVPDGVAYSKTWDDGADESRQRTLQEFVFKHLSWDLGDGTTVFRLACDQSGKGQRYYRPTIEEDIALWNYFLTPYGHGSTNWLTHAEAMVLIGEE